jgi:hypothetical protein
MIVYAVVDDSLSHTFPLADAIETMDLLFRESDVDGEESSYALLPDKRDEFVLALFRGAPRPGTVSEICVGLAADEIETVRAGLQVEAITPEHGKHWLRLTIRWASAGRCRTPTSCSGAAARPPILGSPSDLACPGRRGILRAHQPSVSELSVAPEHDQRENEQDVQ